MEEYENVGYQKILGRNIENDNVWVME